MITITLNGNPHELSGPMTVAELLRTLDIDAGGQARVAVELDREVVPRRSHGEAIVRDGAQVEVVHFVGGGAFP